ncbi:MAG: hypothetical protein LBF36_01525, partial [Mycoplasmataceae bacterium]|nr:hypothetical protein [Mycoplasmataceae bacterium]
MNNSFFAGGMHDVICQSNASYIRWYKGEHVYEWFRSVITGIHNGYSPLKALANNSKIPGYRKDKCHHRKLFYKILKMVRTSLQAMCQCKTKQDFDSLNYWLNPA